MKSRAVLAALALPLIALVTACGGVEDTATLPVAGRTAEVGPSVPVAPSAPVTEPTPTAAECWTETPEWQDAFNATGADPEARILILEALPDPSEGCAQADVERLAMWVVELARIKALPTN